MKNKWFMILLYFFVFLVFYTSTTAFASFIYLPPEFETWRKQQWWEENREDMESSGLEASKPRILTTPMNGINMHGERTVTRIGDLILSESWTPYKPQNYHYVKIGIVATGYGEVAFNLDGHTRDFSIGNWTSEPLEKANGAAYIYQQRRYNNVVNPNLPDSHPDQISPTTVAISSTGSAQTRSRRIVTYGSEQRARGAQAGTSGVGVHFVIGESSYWKWDPGITRDVDADPYNGSFSVTIDDKIWGACLIHKIKPSEASDHVWQAHCPVNITQDGGTVNCTVTGFYKCVPHVHQFPTGSGSQQQGNGGSGSQQHGNGGGQPGNNGGGGVGQNTNQYVVPGSNGGTPIANGGCNTPPPNGGCNTPPANGGCTSTAAGCINPNCNSETPCATYTCIRAIKTTQNSDGSWNSEPCGELFTKCQNTLMGRGVCSRLERRVSSRFHYHTDDRSTY